MRTQAPTSSNGYPPLPCRCIVYRVASRKNMINSDTGEIVFLTFLRSDKDLDGLSVFLGTIDTCEKAAYVLNKAYAVASIGSVRDTKLRTFKLDVIQDEEDHGYVDGLPAVGEDPASAERLATLLLQQSRLCWRR